MTDARDVARLSSQARLIELAVRGLIEESLTQPTDPDVRIALNTAREFADRCQIALQAAGEALPGWRKPTGTG